MTSLSPAMPSAPSDVQGNSRVSARLKAGVLVLLAFGFMASTLLGAAGPTIPAGDAQPAMAAAPAPDAGEPGAMAAESYEVAASVRQWVWETQATDRKPAAHYDYEELWLAR